MYQYTSLDDTFDFFNEHLSKCLDTEMTVIKGQILVEYELNRFILVASKKKDVYNDSQFTFFQKCKIASILGLPELLTEEMLLLNNIRNQIAHKLSYKKESLDLLLDRSKKKMTEAKLQSANKPSFELKDVVIFLCSVTFGYTCGIDPNLPAELKGYFEKRKKTKE